MLLSLLAYSGSFPQAPVTKNSEITLLIHCWLPPKENGECKLNKAGTLFILFFDKSPAPSMWSTFIKLIELMYKQKAEISPLS